MADLHTSHRCLWCGEILATDEIEQDSETGQFECLLCGGPTQPIETMLKEDHEWTDNVTHMTNPYKDLG